MLKVYIYITEYKRSGNVHVSKQGYSTAEKAIDRITTYNKVNKIANWQYESESYVFKIYEIIVR